MEPGAGMEAYGLHTFRVDIFRLYCPLMEPCEPG